MTVIEIRSQALVRRNSTRLALALVAASAFSSLALAQTAPPQTESPPAGPRATSAPTNQVGEIIVTAQKRAENVQNVPVSMTVVTAAQLTTAGVHNFQDLASVAPSLGVTGGGNGQNSSVEMRGVGAYSFSYLTEPDVAVIIDDVPVASQAQAFTNLSDVSQIEVLRGPQTTLFGKSASAGVVSITTEGPSSTFGGKVSTSFTGDGEETFDGTVAGPITDTLAFRLTGSIDDFRGNVKNDYSDTWINGEDTSSLRLKLRWKPMAKLTVDGTGSYTNATGSLGLQPVPVKIAPGTTWEGVGTVATLLPGVKINSSNSATALDMSPANNYDIAQGSVKIGYDLGWATLLSITSYSDYRTYNLNSFDFTAFNILGAFTNGAQNGGINQSFHEETTQTSQEFRLVSGPGAFRYVAGLWYADKTDFYTTVRGPYFPGLGTHLYADYTYHDYSKQYAAYGQSEWDFWPKFTLVTGLRLNNEQIGYNLDNPYKSYLLNGSHTHGVVTGKISLEYHVLKDVNLFAGYTRGYKGETYDLTSSFTPALAANGPVKPETSNSYEVGAKTELLDRHLTLNLTAFDADYSNFQAQTVVPTLGTGFVLANVGSLRTRGIELDSRARITSNLSLNFGLAYLDATIQKYPDGQCYYLQTAAEGCIGGFWNLAGKSLPNAPKWKGNMDAEYIHAIADTGFDGILTGSVRYQSSVNYSLSPDPDTEQGGFAIANLDLTVKPQQGAYKFSVFVNNLFDTHYYNGMTDYTAFSKANTFGFVPRDFRRYYGIRASYAF
jgi:iron complex outermembrane receptor protein